MWQRVWPFWASAIESEDLVGDGEGRTGQQGGRASWRTWWLIGLGLLLAAVIAAVMLALNEETAGRPPRSDASGPAAVMEDGVQSFDQAWVARGNTAQFPDKVPGALQTLPSDWSLSQPGYQGALWYRFNFDVPRMPGPGQVMAVLVERACSNVEVQLNGQTLYTGGRMGDPYARNCYRSHVVTLPAALLRQTDNQLDLKVVGYPISRVTARQRAGGLAGVRIGPLEDIRTLYDTNEFWSITVAQVLGGVLAVMGVLALGLAWVRRLDYLFHFGMLTLGWSAMTGRMWFSDVPFPNAVVEVFIAMLFAPMAAFAIKFLLDYAGLGLITGTSGVWVRRINAALWLQCVLLPASVGLLGLDHLFLVARIWYVVLSIELFAAIGFFLWVAGRGGRPEFWLMSAALGVVAAVLGIELTYQFGWVRLWGIHVTHFVMPLLYAAVAVRLIQVYARALQTAEGARRQLERRVQEISHEIERNFNQIAELRVEQIAEKERKRIAADLHDDLGAKLLTIVHTSDNDRISTLAREALEEMRLSVRGLTGKPMVLSDALADWRAEVVSRLGQAGIECEWRNPNDIIEEPLSSRTYVQTTRILREAVSNIIKHSGASHVVISAEVHLELHDFVLVIQDNGKGIPLELDGRLDRGHGMTSMKHRAKQLSGQCLVESGPGFGTVIRLTLPLEIATMQQVLPTAMPTGAVAASMHNVARGQQP